MKLSLITEVFDKPSLDDVDISTNYSTTKYQFSDDSGGYKLELVRSYSQQDAIQSLLQDKLGDDGMLALKPFLDNFSWGVAVYLSNAESGSYSKTGRGNQWFVYGKVLASITDYVQKNKPLFLYFSGSSSDMNLVYDRFIKMSKKIDPTNSYSYLIDDMFIRDDVLREITRVTGVQDIAGQSEKEYRKEALNAARKEKAEERNDAMGRGRTRTRSSTFGDHEAL